MKRQGEVIVKNKDRERGKMSRRDERIPKRKTKNEK